MERINIDGTVYELVPYWVEPRNYLWTPINVKPNGSTSFYVYYEPSVTLPLDPFGDGSEIAYWKLDGNTQDEHGNYHGVWNGNEQYEEGMFGQAAKFDGYSLIVVDLGYKIQTPFSFTGWIKLSPSTDTHEYRTAIGWDYPGQPDNGDFDFHFRAVRINDTVCKYKNNVGAYGAEWGTSNLLCLYEWYFFYIEYALDCARLVMYDTSGRFIGDVYTYPDKSQTLNRSGFEKFGIGGWIYNNGNFDMHIVGTMDNIRLFNRALSNKEIYDLFKKEAGLYKKPKPEEVFEYFNDFEDFSDIEIIRAEKDSVAIYWKKTQVRIIGGANDKGSCIATKTPFHCQTKILARARTYGETADEYVNIAVSTSTEHYTDNEYGIINAYSAEYWGWKGDGFAHNMATWTTDRVVDVHGQYDDFFTPENFKWYHIGFAYDGSTLYHFKPTIDGSIVIDYQRDDDYYQDAKWKRIFLVVWDGASWVYDYIYVAKYITPLPTITYGDEENESIIIGGVEYTKRKLVTIQNNADEALIDYQVMLDRNQFGFKALQVFVPI